MEGHDALGGWADADREIFLKYGEIFTPRRSEIQRAFLELIPFPADDFISVIDLGAGSGWLAQAILQHYRNSTVVVVDGSQEMVGKARGSLVEFSERTRYECVELADGDALKELYHGADCVVSCLSLHHLNGAALRQCFRDIFEGLHAGGCLLVADIVEAASELGRQYVSRRWSDYVYEQAMNAGCPAAFDIFSADEWNYHEFPDDPSDTPSRTVDQLRWLMEAGFKGVDVFWAEAGHALLGGYKETYSED
jgi:tRNA (cmo5U34)-methyltransferase